jgi:transposase
MHDYEREYDERLRAFRREQLEEERPTITNQQQVIVAGLIARGENAAHVAQILGIDVETVVRWYRNLFLNEDQTFFGSADYSYIREKNILRADARTIGNIILAIENEDMSREQAAEAVGSSNFTINKWMNKYLRDYEIMARLPAGVEYTIKPAYIYGKDEKDRLQNIIFDHDRAEAIDASQSRSAYEVRGNI